MGHGGGSRRRCRISFTGTNSSRISTAEISAYADSLAEEKINAGMSPCEARRSALAEMGGKEHVKQAVRESRGGTTIELFCRMRAMGCAGFGAIRASP